MSGQIIRLSIPIATIAVSRAAVFGLSWMLGAARVLGRMHALGLRLRGLHRNVTERSDDNFVVRARNFSLADTQ